MGEFCRPPFPFQEIPPYLKMAYDALRPAPDDVGQRLPAVVLREGYRNALRFTMEQLPFCSSEDLEWVFGGTALSLWRSPEPNLVDLRTVSIRKFFEGPRRTDRN